MLTYSYANTLFEGLNGLINSRRPSTFAPIFMTPSVTELTPASLSKFNPMLRKTPITNAVGFLTIWQLSSLNITSFIQFKLFSIRLCPCIHLPKQ